MKFTAAGWHSWLTESGIQDLIHRAGPVALEIEGDVREAELLQINDKLFAERQIKEPGDFFCTDLDPRGSFVMETNAKIPEPPVAQKCFRPIHTGKVFARDPRSVREPGGKTGKRRLIPRRESKVL